MLPGPENPGAALVLLTFDDGWAGSVEEAGPILETHGCRALLFVTTGFVGKKYFLEREQLSRLSRRCFRVGSHGRTHRFLSLLSNREIREELRSSKRYLEDVLGYAIDSLSIPSGAIDERVKWIAAEEGYRFCFTSEIRRNRREDGPMNIGRVAIKEATPRQAIGKYVRQELARERTRRWMLSIPKGILGLRRYERLRRRLLGEEPGQLLTHES